MSIVEFLESRLDEDESLANRAASAVNNRALGWGDDPAGKVWSGSDGMVCSEAGEDLWDCEGSYTLCVAPPVAVHMARHDPARILAECAAKRALIATHTLKDAGNGTSSDPAHREVGCETCNWDTSYYWLEYGPCDTIKHLAAVYAGHRDYRKEWAP